MSGQKPREIALDVLIGRQGGEFVEHLLDKALERAHLTPANRRLCQELVYGTVRWQSALDWLIDRKTSRRPAKLLLQNILRLGLYQLFWLDRIPGHAAVNESVQLARQSGFGAQSGFVNAVLRGYARELEGTRSLLADLKTSNPALGYSHPEWLVARWQTRWGIEKTRELMEWNNTPPKVFARVNTLKTAPEKLLPQWRDENVEYDFVRRDWLAENLIFELKTCPPLAGLPSFKQGLFYVQDPSTLFAVNQLAPQPGESILDLCAAPGGKLSFIVQLINNQGTITACDTLGERLNLVVENCHRLGVDCVRTITPSSLGTSEPSTRESFDRILIDAPCSNTGVLRRRVELRWRIRPEELNRLRAAQLVLLRQGAAHLKPGGRLVYSTCSLEPEENERVIEEFLSEQPDFRLEHSRLLLPFVDAVDGAYVASLQKNVQ